MLLFRHLVKPVPELPLIIWADKSHLKFLNHDVLEVPRTVKGNDWDFKNIELREYKKLTAGSLASARSSK
jgi:hypothetical protein